MAQQTINIGTVAGDNTGDPGRVAFSKINDNFSELYSSQLAGTGIIPLFSLTGTNTINAQASPAFAGYVAGQVFSFIASGSNTGGVTINVLGFGAKSIRKLGTQLLVSGDIIAGSAYWVVYDGTNMQLITASSVQSSQIQSSAVTAAKIATNTITATQLANNIITPTQMANAGYEFGWRNRIMNGGMTVDQRNSGVKTYTAAAALSYGVDRWWGACTGSNVTGQRVAGSGATSTQYRYQFNGAASVTGILFGQRIEAANSYNLASRTCTLSVDLANSLLTSVSWAVYYANSTDSFGTLASPTKTLISSGTFTGITSAVARQSASFAVPSAATTGIEVVLSVGAQTSGTWLIGDVQLEIGSTATPFEYQPVARIVAECQRYFYSTRANGTTNQVAQTSYALTTSQIAAGVTFPVSMRATPTVTIYSPNTGTLGAVALYNAIGVDVGSGFTPNVVTSQGFYQYIGGSASLTASSTYCYTYEAVAEL